MNRIAKTILSAAWILSLLSGGALAQSISINGTVAAKRAEAICAPIGGVVETVPVKAGQRVETGDTLATLKTTKVYAEEAGTVRGVFGEAGDNAETAANRYGAVLYIEGAARYTVAASTEYAYSSTATHFVHVGEKVYIRCRSDAKHKGAGVVTAVEGVDFTVEITQGDFLLEESVDIFRSDNYITSTRIGRGDVNRKTPTAVTGSGSIVSMAVSDGDEVRKGQLLFETLDGSFDGLYATGAQIVSSVSGVVSELQLETGASVQKGGVVARIWPEEGMYIEASVPEADLAEVRVGGRVSIELNWNQDADVTYEGVITGISAIAQESNGESEESLYTVWIDFTPDENTRYGMNAVVTTLDEAAEEVFEDDAQTDPED